MRRAVSKKKEKDLLKHRQTFIERGPEHGVDAESAGRIFDDIAFFARYGFGKSHAADYAVITCQTAFLKCHFPHEYMAALMSVYHDVTPRVSLFIADCRRMGIDVLPPDVNYSFKDFSIEEWDDGSRHIRYGMSSIKNLGIGAIEYLLDCRKNKPFRDIDDFLKRCDMQKFGKRGLESLIRVGALGQFGERAYLLANLEKMTHFSAEHHKNAAVGQVSMFDLLGGNGNGRGDDAGSVASTMTEVPPKSWDMREQLRWEKELLGLYISSHPLNAIWGTVEPKITHTVGELNEEPELMRGREVVIAGLVNSIRSITTRNGEPMAILTVEDIHGTIECVMFPRTWAQFREQVEVDKVYLVFGKADMRGTDVNILVEKVTQDLSVVTAVDDPQREQQRDFLSGLHGTSLSFDDEAEIELDEETGEVVKDETPVPEPVREAVMAPASSGATVNTNRLEPQLAPPPANDKSTAQSDPADLMEEPEEFRMAFDREIEDVPQDVSFADDYLDGGREPVKQRKPVQQEGLPPLKSTRSEAPSNGSLVDERTGRLKPPNAKAARPRPKIESSDRKHKLIIEMERTGDSRQDRRRLQKLHGTVQQYPGDDEFCIVVQQVDGGRAKLEFPALRIKIHDELLDELYKWGWVEVLLED
jgi:DNA polymerase-3 subunit alpha